jgi:hypothetical protein
MLNESAHVIDMERQQLIDRYRAAEKQAAEAEERIAQDSRLVLSQGAEGTKVDPLKQWGKRKSHETFEAELKRIVPSSVHFAPHPKNPALRWCYQIINGEQVYISAYPSGLIPERSIFFARENVRPVSGIYSKRGGMSISVLDMPTMKTVRNPDAPGGFESVPADPEALMPGWTRDLEMGSESVRGWRTVLIYLRSAGLISTELIEATFGADDTPEWQGHTGKGPVTTKW